MINRIKNKINLKGKTEMKKTRIITIEKNEKEILEISEKTCKELAQNYKINITNFEGVPTIVSVVFQELFKYLGQHPDEEINFMELFGAGKDDEGVFMYPGPGMKLLVKSDDETEE